MRPSPIYWEVLNFLQLEATLLDDRRLHDWLALFLKEALYWIPIEPDQTDPDMTASHVFERRPVLDARIERLMDPRVIPQSPPSRTCRVIGHPDVVEKGDEILAYSSFHLVEFRDIDNNDSPQRIFAGKLSYRLVRSDNEIRIKSKRIDLINSQSAFLGTSIII